MITVTAVAWPFSIPAWQQVYDVGFRIVVEAVPEATPPTVVAEEPARPALD